MKRTALTLFAISLTATLLVSSGAVPLFDGQTDEVGEAVELVPGDGPNGEYAYLDDDDELVVDLSVANPDAEGVNPNAVTTIDDVFYVRYNGSQYADVWLSHESSAVTFYARGEPIESESDSVTLGPNGSASIGIRVDTTGGAVDGFVDDITLHASVAESEDVSSGSSTAADSVSVDDIADPDPPLSVTVTGTNGDRRDVSAENLQPGEAVEMEFDRLFIVTDNVTLDSMRFVSRTDGDATFNVTRRERPPDGIEPIESVDGVEPHGYFTLDHSIDDSATENVSIRFSATSAYVAEQDIDPDDVRLLRHGADGWKVLETTREVGSPGRLHFAASSPGMSSFAVGVRTSQFETMEASLTPTTVRSGETVTLTAVVENQGRTAGRTSVTLGRDGQAVESRTVELDAGGRTTVEFRTTHTAPGRYNVSVDGVPAGTVTIDPTPTAPTPQQPTPEPSPSPSPTQTAENSSPGQPPSDTPVTGSEAAGFDATALVSVVLVAAVIALGGLVRRRRG